MNTPTLTGARRAPIHGPGTYNGAVLATEPDGRERYATPVFDAQAGEADALIARIIEANRRGGAKS